MLSFDITIRRTLKILGLLDDDGEEEDEDGETTVAKYVRENHPAIKDDDKETEHAS